MRVEYVHGGDYLQSKKVFLFFRIFIFSNPLQFKMILERILASFQLEYYKEIAICIFKELAIVELHYTRALADPHDFNFP